MEWRVLGPKKTPPPRGVWGGGGGGGWRGGGLAGGPGGGGPTLVDHPLPRQVAGGFRDRVRVGEGRQRKALIDRPSQRHAVDAGRAHVHEPADAGRERSSAHVLGAGHV